MEIFALINFILTVGAMAVYGVRTLTKKSKPAIAAPAKAVSAPTVAAHRLVKTYVSYQSSDGDPWIDGWRFLCSCGVKGPATGLVQQMNGKGGKLGNESGAIDKFMMHRDKYLEANGSDEQEHEDTIKLRKLETEFAEWRKACFCKDTNDDLLVLKHRHLDNN